MQEVFESIPRDLKEQGLQQSGACNTSECFAEVGKILGAERMIGGSIGKVGEVFTVTVRIIDVETAVIISTAQRDYSGKLGGLLNELKNSAQELASGEIGGPAKGRNWLWIALGAVGVGSGIALIAVGGDGGGSGTPQSQALPDHLSQPTNNGGNTIKHDILID